MVLRVLLYKSGSGEDRDEELSEQERESVTPKFRRIVPMGWQTYLEEDHQLRHGCDVIDAFVEVPNINREDLFKYILHDCKVVLPMSSFYQRPVTNE